MADEKWVENSARLLSMRLRRTAEEAREFGLLRIINQDLGIPLARANELVREVFSEGIGQSDVIAGRGEDGTAGVVVNRSRYLSGFVAALSAALEQGGPRRRGRRPSPRRHTGLSRRAGADALSQAEKYGVDLSLLREGLKLSRAERLEALDANAAFLREIRKGK
jgi:hypothetical protein